MTRSLMLLSLLPLAALAQEEVNIDMGVQMPGMQAPEMKTKVKIRTKTTRTVTTEESSDSPMAPAPVATTAPTNRDCGTGRDPGCVMSRDGEYPMDSESFAGFLQALKANANELTRQEVAASVLGRSYLTALQLGRVLDLFNNELTRLDVAKLAAPRVVNPQHTLGLASKWRNGLLGKDFTELMASQR